jgi:hypothetical protein
MNAAQMVVDKFGGQSNLAKLIGKGQSTVQYWTKSGAIPSKWQAKLLSIAREQNVDLTAADFVKVPEVVQATGKLPIAEWSGDLEIGEGSLPVYVLDDGRRVISRTGATKLLAGKKGGGQLEKYVAAGVLPTYMPADLPDKMIDFSIPEVVNKTVRGLTAETFLDICRGYGRAFTEGKLESPAQIDMAHKASAFLAACAGVGLIALIDEATGYQYDRAEDALRVKLKAYIGEEMRKWEKTFPDELWQEFGRLTKWKGAVTQRPKYWGKLVMELVYDYLDPDVSKWLKEHAPKPRHGMNYHLWLTGQYGLRKLIEHIWMLIGMARACKTMEELREKKAEATGRQKIRVTVYVPQAALGQKSLFDDLTEEPGTEPGESGNPEPVIRRNPLGNKGKSTREDLVISSQ